MKLDRFILRPVLSTVISIVVVILGVLGLVSLPIEQYPNMAPPTIMVRAAYTGANSQTVLNSGVEQRWGGHDLHDIFCHQRRFGFYHRILQAGHEP